jgi:hypothetical protein
LVLLAQALLVGMSTKWSERVNSGAVSAELIGMLALTGLPRVFRTAVFASFYAASCEFMYSVRTSCGVR